MSRDVGGSTFEQVDNDEVTEVETSVGAAAQVAEQALLDGVAYWGE